MFPNFSAYRPFKSKTQQRRPVQTRKLLIVSWQGEQYALPIEAVLRVIHQVISSDSLLGGYCLIQHQEMFITVINPAQLLLKFSSSDAPNFSPEQLLNLQPNPDLSEASSTNKIFNQIQSFHYLIICPYHPSPLPSADQSGVSPVQTSNNLRVLIPNNNFPTPAQGFNALNYVGIPSVDLPTVVDVPETAFQPLPDLYRNRLRSPGIEAVIYFSETQMLFYLNLSKLLLALKTE